MNGRTAKKVRKEIRRQTSEIVKSDAANKFNAHIKNANHAVIFWQVVAVLSIVGNIILSVVVINGN